MTIWLISDTHFGHANILHFRGADGQLIRPGFTDVEAMDEHMIACWNRVVKPGDHVYHLGDVAMRTSTQWAIPLVKRLNGAKKRLVRGNHDRMGTSAYLKMGFQEIHGMHLLGNCWLTHAPLHPCSMGRALGNIHGHIHQNPSPEGKYLNVCVEALDYTPISLEEAQARLQVLPATWLGEPSAAVAPASLT